MNIFIFILPALSANFLFEQLGRALNGEASEGVRNRDLDFLVRINVVRKLFLDSFETTSQNSWFLFRTDCFFANLWYEK